jgi:hypothetical protein
MSLGEMISFAEKGTTASMLAGARKLLRAGLLKEPLLHFLLLGSLIFAIHAAVSPSVSKDKLIEVPPEVRQSTIELFESTNQRKPTSEELARLLDVWILNEITYREALAQGLDKGDEMIRERIMQKMRLLVFGNVTVNEPTEAELRQWFEARREGYDIPDILSFFELPISGPEDEAEAKSILRQIEAGDEPEEVRLRAHIFANRPRKSLEAAFGEPFVEQLTALPIGRWHMLQSPAGWHIVRFDSIMPGRAVPLDEVETQVISDWKDDRARALGTAVIRDMGKSYVIRRNES